MTPLLVFTLGLAAIIVAGVTLVAIYDPIERAIVGRRIRADARRPPWSP